MSHLKDRWYQQITSWVPEDVYAVIISYEATDVLSIIYDDILNIQKCVCSHMINIKKEMKF